MLHGHSQSGQLLDSRITSRICSDTFHEDASFCGKTNLDGILPFHKALKLKYNAEYL